ncbi:MAG TPA: glycoside hydrolase family 43 protein [Longimicrobiaceae bacterium]|nr:glycoside hydrolase family 43 protein [Longimicrobiaceae bacterium]
MNFRGLLLCSVLAPLLAGCAHSVATDPLPGGGDGDPQAACRFTNPLGPGQDPWVVREGDTYYFVESRDGGIWVSRSDKLARLKQNAVRVWSPPAQGWNRSNVWAPELHHIGGRWYIYYAAGESGPPYIHQRAGVLESEGDDPQGRYVDRGMLYTGDHADTGAEPVWAIDLTVGEIGDRLYAVWSGWEENSSTDKTPQHLYIAPMSDPRTISGDRVEISSPTESWERGTELDLEEGPEFLEHGGDTFIIYSTRESWLKEYRLGQLRLASPGANPLSAASWIKSGPVFTGTDQVYGVGHASFVTSPDGTENWIVYHSKVGTTPGWDRVIRAQPFGWKADGSPDFGTPVPSGVSVDAPSGECTAG